YSELAPIAVEALSGSAKKLNAPLAAVLVKYGVLAKKGERHVVAGRMMAAGLREFVQNKETPAETGLMFASLGDWAEELSVVNAARNQLEKRLRFTALNFVRFSVLQSKASGTLVDRIGRVIDDRRRSRMKHLSADELIEKFNWSDLTELIRQ